MRESKETVFPVPEGISNTHGPYKQTNYIKIVILYACVMPVMQIFNECVIK